MEKEPFKKEKNVSAHSKLFLLINRKTKTQGRPRSKGTISLSTTITQKVLHLQRNFVYQNLTFAMLQVISELLIKYGERRKCYDRPTKGSIFHLEGNQIKN